MTESIEEAFERSLYSTNDSLQINFHDNNFFLLTRAIDPRYKLNFFPENLKNNIKRLLKSERKKYSCCETCQNVEVSLLPPKKPKAQLPKDNVPTNFLSSYSTFKPKTRVQKLRKVSNMI